jgi:hypothetical protein
MNAVLAHEAIAESYGQAVSRECTEITAMSEQLCADADGLPLTLDFIKNEVPAAHGPTASGRGLYLVKPISLPSQKLLRLAYHDLEGVEQITTVHQQLLGETMLSLAGIDPFVPVVAQGRYTASAKVGHCITAEGLFGAMAEQLDEYQEDDSLGPSFSLQPFISVYHDAHGQPILIEKTKDEPSALNLEAVELDGIVIAPLTIVGVAKDMDRQLTGRVRQANGTVLQTYEVTGELALTPRRLSALAYHNYLQRAYFGASYNEGTPTLTQCYMDAATKHSAGDFRVAAAQVMALCGTAELAVI